MAARRRQCRRSRAVPAIAGERCRRRRRAGPNVSSPPPNVQRRNAPDAAHVRDRHAQFRALPQVLVVGCRRARAMSAVEKAALDVDFGRVDGRRSRCRSGAAPARAAADREPVGKQDLTCFPASSSPCWAAHAGASAREHRCADAAARPSARRSSAIACSRSPLRSPIRPCTCASGISISSARNADAEHLERDGLEDRMEITPSPWGVAAGLQPSGTARCRTESVIARDTGANAGGLALPGNAGVPEYSPPR